MKTHTAFLLLVASGLLAFGLLLAEAQASSLASVLAPPLVEAGPDQEAVEGTPVNFSGSFSETQVLTATEMVWAFGDGMAITGTLTPTHAYGDNGVYTVTLTITNELGESGSDGLVVTVTNASPVLLDVWTQEPAVVNQP